MADTTIDSLQIEVESSSSKAAQKLKELSSELETLRIKSKGGAGLNTVVKQLQVLNSVSDSLSKKSASFVEFSKAISSLSAVQKPSGLSAIISSVRRLKDVDLSNIDPAKMQALSSALVSMGLVQKSPGLSSTINSLSKIQNINLSGISEQKMQELSNALNILSNVQKAPGLSSTLNTLKKIPEIINSLDTANLEKFAQQMKEVANAVTPLATEMNKIAAGFASFPTQIKRLVQSNVTLSKSTTNVTKSYSPLNNTWAKFGVYTVLFRRIASVMGDWVNESNDYVENLNLFTVSMGQYAEEAQKYAEKVQDALGIDPSEWMRNQAVFMQIATGFGVVADKAALMSKNLTQIGYDLSSYFNISVEEAMLKVQSGISGKPKTCPFTQKCVPKKSLKTVKSKLLLAA